MASLSPNPTAHDHKGDSQEQSPRQVVTKKTGYEPDELLKAPLKPPEPAETPKPNRTQRQSIYIGLAVVLIGLLLWPYLGTLSAFVVLLIGALIIALGAIIRW